VPANSNDRCCRGGRSAIFSGTGTNDECCIRVLRAIFGAQHVPCESIRTTMMRILISLLFVFLSAPATAQLRPLDPLDWHALDARAGYVASIGFGVLQDQPAARAGSRGRLLELGNFTAAWVLGRVVLEASGTIVRRFSETAQPRPLAAGVRGARGRVRQDAGDMRVTTLVRLSPPAWPALVMLRFGTRLPTTDDRIGLDRDRTDFFALLGARVPQRAAALFAEAGVAINGTRLDSHEQADVLAYSFGGDVKLRAVHLHAVVTGQSDLHDWTIPGNEDLAELRVGARVGDARWLRLAFVRGLAGASPDHGVLVSAGMRIPR
jgi:hypothetical protein